MNQDRWLKVQDLPHRGKFSADGRPLCNWCGTPITSKRRRTWCSTKCKSQFLIRSHSGYASSCIRRRDKGICVKCGLHCIWLEEALWAYAPWYDRDPNNSVWSICEALGLKIKMVRKLKRLWEVDHVLTVKDGGGNCSLSNLQTLCWICHLRKTRLCRAVGWETVEQAEQKWVNSQKLLKELTILLAK